MNSNDTMLIDHGCSSARCDESHPVHTYTAENLTYDNIHSALASGLISEATANAALYGTSEAPSTILSLIADGHLSDAQIKARTTVAFALNATIYPE